MHLKVLGRAGFSFRRSSRVTRTHRSALTSSSWRANSAIFAVDHDADTVGVVGRVKTVRDRHHRSPPQHGHEERLQMTAPLADQHGCRLVDTSVWGYAQHQFARKRHLLGLGRGDW